MRALAEDVAGADLLRESAALRHKRGQLQPHGAP
jgi:hypothetical protein